MQRQFESQVAGLRIGWQFHISAPRKQSKPRGWKIAAKAVFRHLGRHFKRCGRWVWRKCGRAWEETVLIVRDWDRTLPLNRVMELERRYYQNFPPRLAMLKLEQRWKDVRSSAIEPATENERFIKGLNRKQFYIELTKEWHRRGRFADVEFSHDLSRVRKEAEKGKQVKRDVKSEAGATIGLEVEMDSPEMPIEVELSLGRGKR